MDIPAAPQSFDIESWYAEFEPNAPKWDQHPSAVLLQALGKESFNSRSFFAVDHSKAKRANGADDAIKGRYGTDNQGEWARRLEKQNLAGRRVYFVVNQNGDTWNEVASKPGNCIAHFCEFDSDHDFTVADALSTDWSTKGGVGFKEPTACVYSGSFSPHLYWALSEPYENPYRWYINQCRLAQILGADAAVVDLSRVMRLPGFHNTDADGELKRKSLLLFCHPERKYTIDEFEDALFAFEQACGMDPFDAIPVGQTQRPERRKGVISGFIDNFGSEIEEEFDSFFPLSKKIKKAAGSWSDFFDSRSREEHEAALDVIPPFVPNNGTFKGDKPVTLADGRKVHLKYFSVLAGLKASWIQRRLNLDDLVAEIAKRWTEVSEAWIVDSLNGVDGSIAPGTFWYNAQLCGYRLTKPETQSKVGKGLTSQEEGESIVDATKRDAATMEQLYEELYELSSRPIGKGTRHEIRAIKSRLSMCFGIRSADLDLHLLEMIADEHQLPVSQENEVEREELPLKKSNNEGIPELIPGMLNLGCDAVVIGAPAGGKTTLGAVVADRVVHGGYLPPATGLIKKEHRGKVLAILTDGGEDATEIFTNYCNDAGVDFEKHIEDGTIVTYAADAEKRQLSWVFSVRDVKRLIKSLENHSKTDMPIRLVLIDTLQAVVEGAGINTGIGPMGMVMRLMKEICKRYGASVMWLHHTTKDNKDIAAASAEITRVTNSNLYLRVLDTEDSTGKLVSELVIPKHRGKPKRTVHYVLDSEQGMRIATFADEAKQHGDNILLELYRENEAVSPTCIAENLGEGLNRSKVRRILSQLRSEKGFCNTDKKGFWALSGDGARYAEKLQAARNKEMDQSNWDEPTDQSSAAA